MQLAALLLAIAPFPLGAWGQGARGDDSKPSRPVDYLREVRPLLAKNCFPCHGTDEAQRARGLRLDLRDEAVKELKSGAVAIVPGSPDESDLIARLIEEDESLRMPPRKTGERLSKAEIDTLR
jgi:hypothetical protein